MLVKWPIRVKVFVGIGLLLAMVAILSSSGLYSAYAYRTLVKTLSWRVSELPLAAELSAHVADMRVTLTEVRGLRASGFPGSQPEVLSLRVNLVREQFASQFHEVEDTLSEYSSLLDHKLRAAGSMGDTQPEREAVRRIENSLQRIHQISGDESWMYDDLKLDALHREVIDLQVLAVDLPTHLHSTMCGLRRGGPRAISRAAGGLVDYQRPGGAGFCGFRAAVLPLDLPAAGHAHPRVAEGGRRRFQLSHSSANPRRDVGIGRGHERHDLSASALSATIWTARSSNAPSKSSATSNWPASVSWRRRSPRNQQPAGLDRHVRESLEDRLCELLKTKGNDGGGQGSIATNYLRMIQSEAFRCKGITERLLDFSRIGPPKRQLTDLGELVRGVIEMIGHLGRYQGKKIEFHVAASVLAPVNGQELKQVVLNLLTNALDSLEDDGRVDVRLGVQRRHGRVDRGR